MRTIENTIPGYRIFEYQLLLNPPDALRSRVFEVKKSFADKFKVAPAHQGKPQILLTSFVQYELFEDRIINRLTQVALGFHQIQIQIKDFGAFPTHTVILNVPSKPAIQSLVKSIRTETQRLMKLDNENKPLFFLEPHITIARKLAPWQFEQGWKEYQHHHFNGKFIADSMLLLKRPLHGMKYEVLKRFEFMNMPVTTTQGALFM